LAPLPTTTLSAEDAARTTVETPIEKNGVTEEPSILSQAPVQSQPVPVEAPVPVPPVWQFVLAGVALLSALIMLGMRQMAINRWRKK
jgi:hypothetical protein